MADIAPGPEQVDVVVKATGPEPSGTVTAFGIYKVEGGLWRLRRIKTKDARVIEIVDNEPDLLNIQIGKLNNEVEGSIV